MCYAIEYLVNEASEKAAKKAAKEAAREASIFMAIETFRECNMAEDIIKEKIMSKFNLSAEEAKEYMLGKVRKIWVI